MSLTVGKRRGLQQLSTQDGFFFILAIDHRDIYKDMLQQGQKRKVGFEEIVKSKLELISIMSPLVSGVLMDPVYSAYQSIEENVLPKDKGIMVSIEGNDYNIKHFNESNYLMDDIDVQSIKRMGASCVKLFIFYNPMSDVCHKQEGLVRKIAVECKENDIAFLLEPILYCLDNGVLDAKQREMLTYEMIERFRDNDIDIFKIEFPGDVEKLSTDKNLSICKNVTSMLEVPWITLSSGVNFSVLKQQVTLASMAGASGIAVGRTIWKEYLMENDKEVAGHKMKESTSEIFKIISKYGRGWKSVY
ncbi:MAG: tagatose 1,6-diphosphate aldolase [Firmicutes bacterium]|nr:tagatose 1,6-diphosphate aldolase [Bacillota bacterium]